MTLKFNVNILVGQIIQLECHFQIKQNAFSNYTKNVRIFS